MGFGHESADDEPTRDEVDRMTGPVVLEFGASWCGYCRSAEPKIAALRNQFPEVPLVWVEDGPGKPLGRSFRVKLWPTFVFLRDGKELARAVRPESAAIREGLEAISGPAETADQPVRP